MYEQKVREQLADALEIAEAEAVPVPTVATLSDYGMLTSDEGLVLSYPDGSVFTVHIGCYRRPVEPDVEEAA